MDSHARTHMCTSTRVRTRVHVVYVMTRARRPAQVFLDARQLGRLGVRVFAKGEKPDHRGAPAAAASVLSLRPATLRRGPWHVCVSLQRAVVALDCLTCWHGLLLPGGGLFRSARRACLRTRGVAMATQVQASAAAASSKTAAVTTRTIRREALAAVFNSIYGDLKLDAATAETGERLFFKVAALDIRQGQALYDDLLFAKRCAAVAIFIASVQGEMLTSDDEAAAAAAATGVWVGRSRASSPQPQQRRRVRGNGVKLAQLLSPTSWLIDEFLQYVRMVLERLAEVPGADAVVVGGGGADAGAGGGRPTTPAMPARQMARMRATVDTFAADFANAKALHAKFGQTWTAATATLSSKVAAEVNSQRLRLRDAVWMLFLLAKEAVARALALQCSSGGGSDDDPTAGGGGVGVGIASKALGAGVSSSPSLAPPAPLPSSSSSSSLPSSRPSSPQTSVVAGVGAGLVVAYAVQVLCTDWVLATCGLLQSPAAVAAASSSSSSSSSSAGAPWAPELAVRHDAEKEEIKGHKDYGASAATVPAVSFSSSSSSSSSASYSSAGGGGGDCSNNHGGGYSDGDSGRSGGGSSNSSKKSFAVTFGDLGRLQRLFAFLGMPMDHGDDLARIRDALVAFMESTKAELLSLAKEPRMPLSNRERGTHLYVDTDVLRDVNPLTLL
jgi:hypothetical protein